MTRRRHPARCDTLLEALVMCLAHGVRESVSSGFTSRSRGRPMPPPDLELTFAVGPDGRSVALPGQRCKIYPYPPTPHGIEANRRPRA
jgi:hypothetical protein